MYSHIRIWDLMETQYAYGTSRCLRAMRGAATESVVPLATHFKNRLTQLICSNARHTRIPEEILEQARDLSEKYAAYMTGEILDQPGGQERLEAWKSTAHRAVVKYMHYPQASFSKGSPLGTTSTLVDRLRCLQLDPEHMLNWEFVKNNALGIRRVKDLTRKKIALIAPLSGDYLILSAYREYLREKINHEIAIYPVAMDQSLTRVVAGKEILAGLPDAEEVGIYQDTIVTGETGRRLYTLLQPLLGEKLHKPNTAGDPGMFGKKYAAYLRSGEAVIEPIFNVRWREKK